MQRYSESRLNKGSGFAPNASTIFTSQLIPAFNSYLTQIVFEEWFPDLTAGDPLEFADKNKTYKDRLVLEQKKTGMKDACIVGRGYMRGRPLVIGITDSSFIMGSMGSVVGEKLTRAIEQATELKLPLIIISGSGGGGTNA